VRWAKKRSPAFLTATCRIPLPFNGFHAPLRSEVRERRVSTRRAPLDDPHSIKDAYSDSTVSTASKSNEVMAAYRVLRPSGGEKCGLAGLK